MAKGYGWNVDPGMDKMSMFKFQKVNKGKKSYGDGLQRPVLFHRVIQELVETLQNNQFLISSKRSLL